jgi:hypothetical protein
MRGHAEFGQELVHDLEPPGYRSAAMDFALESNGRFMMAE